MGRISNIDRLDENLRKKLIELLNDPVTTQADIASMINDEAGGVVVSKSSVNRYAMRMGRQIEKARQAREIADTYIEKMGGNTRNQLGKVVNEQIRLMCFDLMGQIEEMKESGEIKPDLVIDLIYKVSRGLRELEYAEKLNSEREKRIRKEFMEEAASEAARVLKMEGAGEDAVMGIKKAILGLV